MTITFDMTQRGGSIRAALRPYVHAFADKLIAADTWLASKTANLTQHDTEKPIYALAIFQGVYGGETVEFATRNGLIRSQRHDVSRADLPTRTRSATDIIAESEAMIAIRKNGRMTRRDLNTWRRRRAAART